jgi:hypothetical protein
MAKTPSVSIWTGAVPTPESHQQDQARGPGQAQGAARIALGTLAALQGGLLLTHAKRDVAPLAAALDLAIGQISYHLS